MNGLVPHIVQYQGSKRILAPQILHYMPRKFERLVEPFAGMAAITIAVARQERAKRYVINDINKPLIAVLQSAIETPTDLVSSYTALWNEQFNDEQSSLDHYYKVRDDFNRGNQSPANMLYLLARCVKGSVRYGSNGLFNQSPDKRRNGTSPKTLKPNGYEHAPRAARDVREQGIPLETFRVKDSNGQSIAAYRFGNPSQTKDRVSKTAGRTVLSETLKKALVEKYGSQ